MPHIPLCHQCEGHKLLWGIHLVHSKYPEDMLIPFLHKFITFLWYEGFLANSTNGTGILILENSRSILKGETNSSSSLVSFSLLTSSKTSSTLGMSRTSLASSLDDFGPTFLAWGWLSAKKYFYQGLRSYFLCISSYSASTKILYWTGDKSPLLWWGSSTNFLGFSDP